jgi:hypothetical protein
VRACVRACVRAYRRQQDDGRELASNTRVVTLTLLDRLDPHVRHFKLGRPQEDNTLLGKFKAFLHLAQWRAYMRACAGRVGVRNTVNGEWWVDGGWWWRVEGGGGEGYAKWNQQIEDKSWTAILLSHGRGSASWTARETRCVYTGLDTPLSTATYNAEHRERRVSE